MAFDVSGLPEYVNEQSKELLTAAQFGGVSKFLAKRKKGIKHKESVKFFSSNLVYQTQGCSLTPSGNMVFSQKELAGGKIAIEEEYCVSDLREKWTQLELKSGSDGDFDSQAFFQALGEEKVKSVAKQEEKGFWQADTGSGDANLNKYDGAIKLIDALGNTINGNPDDITAVTSANIIAVVDKQIELIGEDWEDTDNKEVILGRDLYKMYTTALRNLNLYHHEAVKGDFSMQIPGAEDVTLRGVSGLNGTNRIFTTYWDNLMSGCDDESEEDEFRWVYDDVNEIWRLKIKFKSGVQVGFGQEIVQFELHTP